MLRAYRDGLCCRRLRHVASAARIREQAHASQPIFARYLNTSESTAQKWEGGTKRPSGMALKLLAVVEKHGLKVLA
jgi:putative transcriptional regulator